MAGSLKGEVRLTFEGNPLTLVLDFNALCDFENEVGENAQTRLALLEKGKGTFSDMRALLWAMLQAHHPDMTPKDAGNIIGADLGSVGAAFAAAFEAAFPNIGEKTGKKLDVASKEKPRKAKALRGR